MPRITFCLTPLIVILFLNLLHAAPDDPPPKPRVDLYGDPLPEGAVARLGTVRVGGSDPAKTKIQRHQIWSITITPDSRKVITCSYTEESGVRVWELETGKPLFRPIAPRGVWAVSCSPMQSRFVGSVTGDTPRFWDADTGKEIPGPEFPEAVMGVVYSPDGTRFASTDATGIRVWDAQAGKQLVHFARKSTLKRSIFFTTMGDRILEQDQSGMVYVHDLARVESTPVFRMPVTIGIGCIDPSPDGRTVAGYRLAPIRTTAAPPTSASLTLFESWSGQERLSFGTHAGGYNRVAHSRDGSRLITAGADNVIRFWNTRTGEEVGSLKGHEASVVSLALAPDGRHLVSGSADATALVWDVSKLLGQESPPKGSSLSAQELDKLYSTLASPDASAAYKVIWQLVASPKESVPFLAEKLKPVAEVDGKRVEALIAAFDSEKFAEREKASEELAKLGEAAEPGLKKLLAGQPTAEAKRRAEELLDKLGGVVTNPEQLRTLRAIEALEHIGTPEAKQILDKLANGAAGARETEDARRSLQRLKRKS
jgi:WD40 repeat protein